MKLINGKTIDRLCIEAVKSDRKRTHHILNPAPEDPIQRLCVAIDRGSYIRPHRHAEEGKWELFIAIKGSATFLTFDNEGRVAEKIDLSDKGPVHAVEIPANTWHTLAAQENGTILFEIKPGPYYGPLPEHDFAPWAPMEGTDRAVIFEELFHSTEKGNIITDNTLDR